MLAKVKLALRIKTTAFDTELNTYIKACKKDLVLSGLNETMYDTSDDNIVSCTFAFCKWQMDFQSKGDKWKEIYFMMKQALILDSNYH